MTATFFLTGSARVWWTSQKQTLPWNTLITWEVFKEKFNARLFTLEYKTRRRNEFIYLQQGNMSMTEYERKFIELSKYCTTIANNPVEMLAQFHIGLDRNVRIITSSHVYQTY